MEELLKSITRAVEDKVFSPEILSNIAALRIKVVEQEQIIDRLESELKSREESIIRHEMLVEMHKALAAQSKEYVGMIFRNHNIMTTTQETIVMPSTPPTQYNPGNPAYTMPVTNVKTETQI